MKLFKKFTVCYIKRSDDKILFLERNKKKNDINHGKYIGIGGKIEENETPDECIVREVYEETNIKLNLYKLCGVVRYYNDDTYDEMYVYYSDDFDGNICECNEGTLHWLLYDEFLIKPHWKGDEIFLSKALFGEKFGLMEFK